MLPPTNTLLAAALAATCVTAAKGKYKKAADDCKKILIGGGPTGLVGAADFDGSSFDIVANNTIAGTSASWLLFKEPNLLYAVDENSDQLRLFNVRHSDTSPINPSSDQYSSSTQIPTT